MLVRVPTRGGPDQLPYDPPYVNQEYPAPYVNPEEPVEDEHVVEEHTDEQGQKTITKKKKHKH